MPGVAVVTAPWVEMDFFGQTGPDRIQMNISCQCQQVRIFFANNGFIASLE
ncbi:hypothetical protein [Desulfoscipio geothermicus]|uniref:hypothetical protein n=1 Tax=Desulfoscipio geothermicus TaxID=39060 RepID=UPI001FE69F88|nr:hypothetical protein [Desulfoscipio geothermicus]